MNYIDRSILKSLKSGQYFIDAINWYERKYIFPSTERSILFILALVFLLTSAVTIKYTNKVFPLHEEISFPIISNDIDDFVPIIKKISRPEESIEYSLAKYLLSNYLIIRESYDYYNIETQLNIIKNNSFRKVYEEYAQQLDLSKIDSAIYKYQNNFTRKIEIISAKSNKDLDTIEIFFNAKVMNYLNQVIEESEWKAEMSFIMSDIDKEKENNKLNFLVSEYKVEKVK